VSESTQNAPFRSKKVKKNSGSGHSLYRGQKVKVTRPINARAVNVQYLPNGKAYELQTVDTQMEDEALHQRQAL